MFSPCFGNSPGFHQLLELHQIEPDFTVKRTKFNKKQKTLLLVAILKEVFFGNI